MFQLMMEKLLNIEQKFHLIIFFKSKKKRIIEEFECDFGIDGKLLMSRI
jgi:hypothetical protein